MKTNNKNSNNFNMISEFKTDANQYKTIEPSICNERDLKNIFIYAIWCFIKTELLLNKCNKIIAFGCALCMYIEQGAIYSRKFEINWKRLNRTEYFQKVINSYQQDVLKISIGCGLRPSWNQIFDFMIIAKLYFISFKSNSSI